MYTAQGDAWKKTDRRLSILMAVALSTPTTPTKQVVALLPMNGRCSLTPLTEMIRLTSTDIHIPIRVMMAASTNLLDFGHKSFANVKGGLNGNNTKSNPN